MFYKHKTLPLSHYKSILLSYIPSLSSASIKKLHGYDSVVLVANNERLFKFPQRPEVIKHYLLEDSVLPYIDKFSQFELPIIVNRFGTTENWSTYMIEVRKLHGNHLSTVMNYKRVGEDIVYNFGKEIGKFLVYLHSIPPNTLIEKGVIPFDDKKWESEYVWIEEHCFPLLSIKQQKWVKRLYDNFLDVWKKKTFKPTFIHGDFGNYHIYATLQKIIGFIDWGAMRIDDPAHDLKWISSENIKDIWLKNGIISSYYPLDATFSQRTKFYKTRMPISKFIKGIQRNDKQRIKDGFLLLEQFMGCKT